MAIKTCIGKPSKGDNYKSYGLLVPIPLYLINPLTVQNSMTYVDDKVKQRPFQQSRECNSKINDPIWPVFDLFRYFMHVHLICKFQEHPIKTEWVTLMTKSNRSFFSNQGDVTVWLMIRSGQLMISEISSISILSARFRNIDQNWSSYSDGNHFPIVSL